MEPGSGSKRVEGVNLVDFRGFDLHKGRNVALQVEQGMQLDGCVVGSVSSPGTKGKTKVDGGAIQSVDRLLQLYSEILVGIKRASHGDQSLGQIGIDAKVASLVGIGQGAARHMAADAQMIEPRTQSSQTGLAIAQTFAIGQLGEGHAQKLVPAGKSTDLVVALIAIDATMKFVRRDQIHQLRKDRSAQMHACYPLREPGKDGQNRLAISNRKRCISSPNSWATVGCKKTRLQ